MKLFSHFLPELVILAGALACSAGVRGYRGTELDSAAQASVNQFSDPSCAASNGCVPEQQDPSLPPAGYGSLRQDQVGVTLGTPNLRIRVLPLDEAVIRLLAPDAYRSLRDMRESRAAEIQAAARAAGRDSVKTFMVTFFGMQPQARFSPDELLITSQNSVYRPVGRVAITPRFNENLLDAREQAAAIYLYEPSIAILRPFTVSYTNVSSDAWTLSVNLLNGERTRVLSRARP